MDNVLHRVPGVREAAVIGVPDAALGEAVRAFVASEDGAMLTEQDGKKACVTALESFTVPSSVVFIPELPNASNAKRQKHDLREFRV